MQQDEDEFLFRQSAAVLGIVENVEQTAAGAQFHHDDFPLAVLFLFDGQQFDDVFVVDLFEDFKLPDLHFLRSHVTQLIERLDRHGLSRMLRPEKKI